MWAGMLVMVLSWLLPVSFGQQIGGPMITELHQLCTAEQGFQARCGPGANCLILGGVPTCHCITDQATGLPLAGNPYRGCTWDLTGKWVVNLAGDEKDSIRGLNDPFSNEPYVIHIDRTDAVLKTQYITGTIFVVTAVTGAASGVCGRVFLDVNDNQSVIFELAEGFVDGFGRNMYFRNSRSDVSLTKKLPKRSTPKDAIALNGCWRKWDGSRIKVCDFKHERRSSIFRPRGGSSAVITPGWAYWYNDDSFGAPAIRLSTALFLDDTLPFEQAAFETTNRFIQLGWFGYLAMGASAIHIVSPADGHEIFTIKRLLDYNIPLLPGPQPQVLQLSGRDQIQAIATAANAALGNGRRMLGETATSKVRGRRAEDDEGIFSGMDRLREMGALNETAVKEGGPSLSQSGEGPAVTRHLNKKSRIVPYPTPTRLQLPPQCPAEPRSLFSFPKTTLDDLNKFKPSARAQTEGASPKAKDDEVFWKSDFFGLDDDDATSDTPYDFLWRRMSHRLKQAETVGDDLIKKLIGRRGD